MLRFCIVTIIFLLIGHNLYAQQGFEIRDSSLSGQLCHYSLETSNGYLIFYGSPSDFIFPFTEKVFLLSKDGSDIEEISSFSDVPYRVHNMENWNTEGEWIVDIEYKLSDSIYQRCIRIIDDNFITLREYCLDKGPHSEGFAFDVIEGKYIFIYNIDLWTKTNINVGIFDENEVLTIYNTKNRDFNFASSVINSLDSSQYIIYCFRGICSLDKDIENYTRQSLLLDNHGTLKRISDSRFAAFGVRTTIIPDGPFGGFFMDNILKVFNRDYQLVREDTIGVMPVSWEDRGSNFPALVQSLDFNGEYLFTATNSQMDHSIFFQSTKPREVHVIKHDTLLNRQWKIILGGDVNTLIHGMYATEDGGCLLYGLRKTHGETPVNYPYVVKLNSDGLITSTITDPGIQEPSLTLYGNPSSRLKFYLQDMPSWKGKFFIYDLSGKLLTFSDVQSGMVKLDTENWVSGMYVIQIMDSENKLIHSVKWVKN